MSDKVPRLVPGVDVRRLRLDPTDGFVMTRIDGRLRARDLARETGLPEASVARALEKLEKLGVIESVDPNAAPKAPTPLPSPPPEGRTAIAFDMALLAPKYDPQELEAPADLPLDRKKRVLDLYYRLDDLDHYTLLGVTREVDKKGIKRAYFELAAVLHPDRYFKKELGVFKPKMEVVFTRITEAHDTLVDAAKRAEYDSYLAEVATTRGMEAMLERALAESARAAAEAPPAPAEAPAAPLGPTAEELQRRKEALARRLVGGQRAQATSKPPPAEAPNPLQYASAADAVDALKRRYEERTRTAVEAQVERYKEGAKAALEKNDLVAASTALGFAAKLAPDDALLATRAKEVQDLADRTLCESYLKQAEYEERQEHWPEAARSWMKVARIKGDAASHAKAANALLLSPDGDLRQAAEHAKRAIALEPAQAESHVTLVQIYVKAGLSASARKAAEAASTLHPTHAGLQAAVKRIGKA